MKSLPSIKRVLYPSWAKLSVLAAGVCAAILVCSKTEIPRNDVKVYPALPVVQSSEITAPEALNLPPVPSEEEMLADLKASEPEMETIPEAAPVEAPIVEAPKPEPVKLAAQKAAPHKKAPTKKVAAKKVSAPKKHQAKLAKLAKVNKRVKPVIEKVVTVAPPLPIIVPVEKRVSADAVMQAFAWLAAEKMTPQMAKRLKKIEASAQIERLAEAGLEELPQIDDYSQTVAAPIEMALSLEDEEIAIEPRNAVLFAEFKQNQFAEQKARLKARQEELKSAALEAPKSVGVPEVAGIESSTTQSVPASPTDGAARVAALKANPEIEEELETIPEESARPIAEESAEPRNQLVAAGSEPQVEGPIVVPNETDATPDNAALDLLATGAPSANVASAPVQTNILVDTRNPANQVNSHVTTAVAKPTPPKPVIHIADNSGRRSNRKNLSANTYGLDPVTVQGRFTADDAMDAELESMAGHVELQLIPVSPKTEDQEHPVIRRFRYPGTEKFEIPKGLIHGEHRLYARVYKGDETFPKATIPYHSNVSEFVRENVKFHLTKSEYDRYLNFESNVPTNERFLYVTVAKALEGNREEPERIKNARVRIVGYPDGENNFRNLSDGDLNDGVYKLARVPSRSEFLIEVEADGYLRTDKVHATFGTDSKTTIYMLSKNTVEAARQWATPGLPLDAEKAVVFGRVFDARVAGKTIAGERVSMEYRNGPTIYFGSVFPDMGARMTTESGIFAFFNLVPSVRAIYRETVGKMPILMSLRKHSGYLVDLGRGSFKNLRGQLFDTLNNLHPEALVSIHRQKDVAKIETNGTGGFEVRNVDVSNDVVMLKVENEHYPTFLYPIPVDTRANISGLNLFMLDQRRYDEVLQDLPGGIISGKGHVLGGAEASLFSQSPDCLRIELTDLEGVKVDSSHGPFPWGGSTSTCFDQNNPRWAFKNLYGRYTARWVDKKGRTVRSHVFLVDADPSTGKGYATMVIN